MTAVVRSHGGPETLLNVVRDVTTRVETAAALVEAEQSITLAHDRQRIARDLHDRVIQQIFAVGIGLQATTAVVDESTTERITDFIGQLDESIAELRSTIFGLDRRPLRGGVEQDLLRVLDEERVALGFDPHLALDGPLDLIPPSIAEEIVPVLREAVSNVARHANSTQVDIVVTHAGHWLTLTLEDDGVGLQPSMEHGDGLDNMARRAADLGGRFRTEARSSGGTRIRWTVPLGD